MCPSVLTAPFRKLVLVFLAAGLLANGASAATYVYEETPGTTIPDTGCTNYTQIPINVPDTFTVSGVNVGLNISHTRRRDLGVRLRAPNGTTADLFAGIGDDSDNLDIMLERDAGWQTDSTSDTRNIGNIPTGNHDIAAPFYDHVFTPQTTTAMDVFNGLSANGTWNLEVCDAVGGETGTVNRVLLSFTQGINPLLAGDSNSAGKVCSASGADGSTPTSGVVNTYYPATSSAAAGATTLALGSPIGSATGLAAGDLVMIIQMQDAVFDTSASAPTYDYGDANPANYTNYTSDASGSTSIGATGLYEFATVASFSSGTLTLNAPLVHSYFAGTDANGFKQTFQVIRVPRYRDLTLSGDIKPQPWDGSAGGVVVLDVLGTLNFNGFKIDAAGSDISGAPVGPGFRPGVYVGGASGGQSNADPAYAASPGATPPDDTDLWGEKGEGIAGTPSVSYGGAAYPGGDLARGAPGNAGGGANDHNGGGGGGSNIGWGGQGGDGWSNGIGAGGRGGGSFEGYNGRLLMGGGGGAANANNNTVAGQGGSGGGIVFINATTITGIGTIDASGGRAEDSNANGAAGNDGAGGGGAGGTVVLRTASTNLPNLTIDVSGGDGGDVITPSPHGPGGGGGGGAVYTNATVGTVLTAGGKAGRFCSTSTNPCTDQGTHGATDGGPGQQLALDEVNLPVPIACEYPDENGYGSTTAVHKIDRVGGDPLIAIGSVVDYEPVAIPTANAEGDDGQDTSGNGAGDDETGVTFDNNGGQSVIATVSVNNPSGASVTVCGWLDGGANGTIDGTYDAAEGQCTTTNQTGGTVSFTWTGLPETQGTTYARFRIASGNMTVSDASTAQTNGETESYQINFDFRPTAVTMGEVRVALRSVDALLGALAPDGADPQALRVLLGLLPEEQAAGLEGADAEAVLAAARAYLDPDGDGRVAVLHWTTVQERGTLGFYAERSDDGGRSWHRLRERLLPGLVMAPLGGEYQLADPGAGPGRHLYRIVELEAKGDLRHYGPYELEVR